jgi:hypothetical protein
MDVDNSDQRGTSLSYKFLWIAGAPTSVECHNGLDCKKLGKLVDAKRGLGYDQALE